MKRTLLSVLLLLTLLFAGCSQEQYGAGLDPAAPKVQVRDIFLQPALMGKQVTLEGTVVSQCQSNGCWFFLKDDTGQIYIDLSTNQFALPAMPGKRVVASGQVARSQQNVLLVASGVEVK